MLREIEPPLLFRALSGTRASLWVYTGVRLDAAVNLLEAREYHASSREERLRTALAEQRQMVGGLLGYSGRAAFDLRMSTEPTRSPRLQIAVVARTAVATRTEARAAESDLIRHLLSGLPRHVTASPIPDDELTPWLDPFPNLRVQAALVTKRELIATPTRRDARIARYFSVAPFSTVEADWNPLYAALTASTAPVTVSVALFPITPPRELQDELSWWATFYGRLAREDERGGGLYYGRQKLPPDAFAIDAERVFQDYLRRCGRQAFLLRVQVTSPDLPKGILEEIGSAVSPPEPGIGNYLERDRAAATYDLRWFHGDQGATEARWNLSAIDCWLAPGRPEIWQRPDRPTGHLALLSSLGDTADAAGVFRLPIAIDGVVPGFPVRRGQFGHREAYPVEGPAITIGALAGGQESLRFPLTGLTRHTLVAGSTGSGKTTTVLELLRQLWLSHHVPFLVIEPVNAEANDYRKLGNISGFNDLRLITVGDEGAAPLRFNPFEVPVGVLVGEHTANLLACFKAAFGLWEPLPSIYQDALNLTYLNADILASEVADQQPRQWPTVVEFLKAMREATSDLGYAGDVKANIEAASIRRAQQFTSGPSASAFLTDQQLDMKELLSVPVVIELKALGGGDEQALMMALLLNAMTEHYKANRCAAGTVEHVTVVEEAHRLLSRPEGARKAEEAQSKEKAAEEFANTLAENRKYGEAMLLVEQIPTKLVADAVKNTNLKIVHRLTSEEDRRYLGESMGLDDAQQRFAARLTTGEALTYSDNFAEAAHITTTRTLDAPAGVARRIPTPPFAGCSPCRAKCTYRGAALAVTRHPQLRRALTDARRAVGDTTASNTEIRQRWKILLDLLRDTVRRFPALPNEDPWLTDAAYCLFLHSLAIDSMTSSPRWPPSVASRLGIAAR